MSRQINPSSFPPPQSNYSQGIAHGAASERLVISGQVGVKSDGSVADGLDAQMHQTWQNFMTVLSEAGFAAEHVIKVTIFTTVPALDEFRRTREEYLAGYAPAATYVQVAGLANAEFIVEIEGEAVKKA